MGLTNNLFRLLESSPEPHIVVNSLPYQEVGDLTLEVIPEWFLCLLIRHRGE